MTPAALAALHRLCFTTPRPWRADEFATLLTSKNIFLITQANGFALGRIAGPEAELLTIAVPPKAQNAGHGRRLVAEFIATATQKGAKDIFLEVAENNAAAIALYRRAGFAEVAKREQYFKQINGPALTALVLKYTI